MEDMLCQDGSICRIPCTKLSWQERLLESRAWPLRIQPETSPNSAKLMLTIHCACTHGSFILPDSTNWRKMGCTSKQSQVHQFHPPPPGHPDEFCSFCLLYFLSLLWDHGPSVANLRWFKEQQGCLLGFLSCLKSLFQSALQRLALASFQLQPMAHLHTAQGRICALSPCYYTAALTGNPYVSAVAI